MGKHTQNCTLIGKGVYGTIGVDQRSRLADGAHFHTMIVTSTLEASVIEGDKLVIKSGIVRCDGDIRVSSISGSGDIEVGGDIICDEITFTGKLRCNGDIVCSGNLSVNGSLGTRHISGQTVRLNGVLKGHDVNSRGLEVRFGNAGGIVTAACMVLFAFATILAWFYIGDQALGWLMRDVPQKRADKICITEVILPRSFSAASAGWKPSGRYLIFSMG